MQREHRTSPPPPSRMLGYWEVVGEGQPRPSRGEFAGRSLGRGAPLAPCGFHAGQDVDPSTGSLNQARTAVCQRYKNMQSPSSLFFSPPPSLESWLVQ